MLHKLLIWICKRVGKYSRLQASVSFLTSCTLNTDIVDANMVLLVPPASWETEDMFAFNLFMLSILFISKDFGLKNAMIIFPDYLDIAEAQIYVLHYKECHQQGHLQQMPLDLRIALESNAHEILIKDRYFTFWVRYVDELQKECLVHHAKLFLSLSLLPLLVYPPTEENQQNFFFLTNVRVMYECISFYFQRCRSNVVNMTQASRKSSYMQVVRYFPVWIRKLFSVTPLTFQLVFSCRLYL